MGFCVSVSLSVDILADGTPKSKMASCTKKPTFSLAFLCDFHKNSEKVAILPGIRGFP